MKFMAKTTMNGATYRDLSLAMQQGTTTSFELGNDNGYSFSSNSGFRTFFMLVFFVGSCGLMFLGVKLYRLAKRKTGIKPSFSVKEPLVFA